MAETMVAAGDARLCTEAFGAPEDPAVLLIMGQMASMLWWPEGLCERLAAAGRFVLRYDHRDTGRSTAYPPGRPGYSGDDLVADAAAVLEAHGVARAHVVGFSAGGALAQVLALARPELVITLTVISSSPLRGPTGLPGPDPAYLRHAAGGAELDWSDRAAVADHIVGEARALSGARPFDEEETRRFVERDLARTTDTGSLPNPTLVPEAALPSGTLAAPLLVIHGTADPVFPLAHGEALAGTKTSDVFVPLEGGGHALHEQDWPLIVDAIVRHTA
jgi:pimeloyl-ACP methyl ester carboxylesterase